MTTSPRSSPSRPRPTPGADPYRPRPPRRRAVPPRPAPGAIGSGIVHGACEAWSGRSAGALDASRSCSSPSSSSRSSRPVARAARPVPGRPDAPRSCRRARRTCSAPTTPGATSCPGCSSVRGRRCSRRSPSSCCARSSACSSPRSPRPVRGGSTTTLLRIVDIFMAFPSIVLALGIAAALGPSLTSVVIAMVVAMWPATTRLVRGVLRETMSGQYVEAARLTGMSSPRGDRAGTCCPTRWTPSTCRSGSTSPARSSSSPGSRSSASARPPPSADWGSMVAQGREYITTAWWVSLFPGLAITHRGDRVRSARRRAARPGSTRRWWRRDRTPGGPRPRRSRSAGRGGPVLVDDASPSTSRRASGSRSSESPARASRRSRRRCVQLDPTVTVSGSIRFDGAELVGAPGARVAARAGRQISMIFQDPMTALNPVQRIGDQVAEPLVIRGVPRHEARGRAVEMLDRLGVPSRRRAGARLPVGVLRAACGSASSWRRRSSVARGC